MKWIAMAMLMVMGVGCQEMVHFTIDGMRDRKAISPYIYGVNEPLQGYSSPTLVRTGGNRWTAYNWTNNASNAGNDWHFQSDNYLSNSNAPGAAVNSRLRSAAGSQAAALVTIPINGYVAADKRGDGDVRTRGVDVLATRFRISEPHNAGAFSLRPRVDDPVVYQDEFVNWLRNAFPERALDGNGWPIWFALDNEPDLWASTHEVLHPDTVTYAEVVEKNIAYARAIKAAWPGTLVFGPVNYGWQGFVSLQHAPDGEGRDFQEFYLDQMREAEAVEHRRLLDVLDVHWYPEARGGGEGSKGGIRITEQDSSTAVAEARMQAPRSLWDSTYREKSWIVEKSLHEPIALLPRLWRKIDGHYPGTKVALTEYNFGGGSDISGAIAQADVLGLFGRYGIFAACEWPLVVREPSIGAAFALYRNFDGAGGQFGDTSVWAATDDAARSSVYAGIDGAGRITIVAINKTGRPIAADCRLMHLGPVRRAEVYTLTAAAAAPVPGAGVAQMTGPRFRYQMPPLSVSMIRLSAGRK